MTKIRIEIRDGFITILRGDTRSVIRVLKAKTEKKVKTPQADSEVI